MVDSFFVCDTHVKKLRKILHWNVDFKTNNFSDVKELNTVAANFLQYNLFFAFVVQKCRDKMSPQQHSVKQNFVKFRFSPLDEVSWFSLISQKPRSSFSRKYKILLSRCGSKKLFTIQRCYENVTTVLVIVICKFRGFVQFVPEKKQIER